MLDAQTSCLPSTAAKQASCKKYIQSSYPDPEKKAFTLDQTPHCEHACEESQDSPGSRAYY